jgi:hypothetical protein
MKVKSQAFKLARAPWYFSMNVTQTSLEVPKREGDLKFPEILIGALQ